MQYRELKTAALFYLKEGENSFRAKFSDRHQSEKLYTLAWNRGGQQMVTVDGLTYNFPPDSMLPLMVNQSFSFERPETVTGFQFNREFYCIIDHDKEVSCAGFLFYGVSSVQLLKLPADEVVSLDNLLRVFREEFAQEDHVQGEMLRMLLKRLIIKVTRLARKQLIPEGTADIQYDLVRQFNVEVEWHFKQQHTVAFYAGLLHRSPKTLSNLFKQIHDRSPLQVIHDRIMLEARRLLLFTDKSTKEIAYELGFEEAANFSRFFSKLHGMPPSSLREKLPRKQ